MLNGRVTESLDPLESAAAKEGQAVLEDALAAAPRFLRACSRTHQAGASVRAVQAASHLAGSRNSVPAHHPFANSTTVPRNSLSTASNLPDPLRLSPYQTLFVHGPVLLPSEATLASSTATPANIEQKLPSLLLEGPTPQAQLQRSKSLHHLKDERSQSKMANGYVPPPQHFGMRRGFIPFRNARPPPPPPPPASDPSILFATKPAPHCAFPENTRPSVWQILRFSVTDAPVEIYTFFSGLLHDTLKENAPVLVDRDLLTAAVWENSWSIFIGLACVVVMSLLAWFFSPKGENQTVWRSTLILTISCCYLMWAITFLAQYHPLIDPKMTSLRGSADWSGVD